MAQAPDQTKEQTQRAASRPATRPKQFIKMKPIATSFHNVKILAPFAITPSQRLKSSKSGKKSGSSNFLAFIVRFLYG